MSRQDFDFARFRGYYFAHVDNLWDFLFVAPVLLFSVIAHEYAHGYAALRQGDPTAQQLGRLTWNPIRHIDPFLTIVMPILTHLTAGVALGGAKPVPVDPRNYRNFVRGDIIVSLAGVTVNLALAFLCAGIILFFGWLARGVRVIEPTVGIIQVMMMLGIQINLMLLMFNLIPIPPLDGSHVVKHMLPPGIAAYYQRLGFLGLIILVVLMRSAPGFLTWWFGPAFRLARALRGVVGDSLTPTYFAWVS